MNRGELADGDEDIEDPELAPCDSARTRTIHVAHGGSFGNDVAECYTVHHLPQWTLHAGMDTVPWALLMGFPRNWSNFMVAVPYFHIFLLCLLEVQSNGRTIFLGD